QGERTHRQEWYDIKQRHLASLGLKNPGFWWTFAGRCPNRLQPLISLLDISSKGCWLGVTAGVAANRFQEFSGHVSRGLLLIEFLFGMRLSRWKVSSGGMALIFSETEDERST
ncbi:unnamed protein product, partial [Tuber aestivum]